MESNVNNLLYALQISGIGIVVLLLVLLAFAGIVWLMTRYIVGKPEKEEEPEEAEPSALKIPGEKSDLGKIAAVALALARAQAEIQTTALPINAREINSWRQFNLHRRLTQSQTLRRTR